MIERPSASPPIDAELEHTLKSLRTQFTEPFTLETFLELRETPFTDPDDLHNQLLRLGLSRRDIVIRGYQEDDIVVTVIARSLHTGLGPAIYHIHGGGMIIGDQTDGVAAFFDMIERHDAVLVSVRYRLAPEFPDPFPVEDCYSGLMWLSENAEELGIDRERILIGGSSAGGGLSAGTALLARDRKGPSLIGQILMCPMLDDRDATISSAQVEGFGVWERASNAMAWTALLGARKGMADVSIYAAPARATDLSGLPPAYIDCGSAEVFRDEDVAYAAKMWEAGAQAELHVWAGGFHEFEVASDAQISRAAVKARRSWIDRLLAPSTTL